MPEFQQLCMGCMREIDANLTVCPHCGYDATTPQYAPYLPKRAVLLGKYLVGKLIRIEADSAIYIGQALDDGATVTIREFLPERLIRRAQDAAALQVQIGADAIFNNAMGSFESLWRAIMGMEDSPALPRVREVFFCNSTAYAVTEALDCITLRSYIESGKRLTWESACKVFKPVILALDELHSLSILHAAIDPSDLLVGADGRLHIDGFTIPQTKADIPQLAEAPVDGFAPLERYEPRLRLGAFTDVYSVAAAMYFCLSGMYPQSAPDRAVQDQLSLLDLPEEVLPTEGAKALAAALQVYPQRRIRTMDQLLNTLFPVAPTQAEPPAPVVSRPQPVIAFPEEDPFEADALPEEDDDGGGSVGLLALKVFVTAGVIAALLFCTLYATVLFRYINVPVLNSAFSAFSFLPINEEPPTTTTQPTVTAAAETTVEVPNFAAHTYHELQNNPTFNEDFELQFEFEASDTVPKNSVIRQSIPAGTKVEKETEITIVISSGIPQVLLQDVIGMDYAAAQKLLTADGFQVEREVVPNDGGHPADEVCGMNPVAGLHVLKGTKVTLRVWDAPPATEAPVTEETAPSEETEPSTTENPLDFLTDLTLW